MTPPRTTWHAIAEKVIRFRKRKKKAQFGATDKPQIVAPVTLAELPQAQAIAWGGPIYSHPSLVRHKLWSGFSNSALRDLDEMLKSTTRSSWNLNSVAWSLAEWFAVHGEYSAARAAFEPHLATYKLKEINTKNHFLAVYCAVGSGDFEAARRYCHKIQALDPGNKSLPLAMANAHAAESGPYPEISQDQRRLDLINTCYAGSEIAPLRKKDPDTALSVTNLYADVIPASEGLKGPKVSIIVPVYNGARTLGNTLDSLLAQSWANLEILVVDDCSTDDSSEIITSYQARDPRIVKLKTPQNSGSYTARNLALAQASGELITVHDANDWSHPQKIAQQAKSFMQRQYLTANHSHRSRVDDNLIFQGKFRHKWRLLDWDPSSFMIRRSAAFSLGGWDEVRISADSEFIERAKRVYGARVVSLPESLGPLSFAFEERGSLTLSGPTHGRTIYHGVRREYGEAARYWRSLQSIETLARDPNSAQRPFPVPGLILPQREYQRACELLLVADFNAGAPLVESVLEQVRARETCADQIAIFQWRYYSLDTTTPLTSSVRDMVHTRKISHLIPGETMRVDRVLVLTPDALAHPLDNLPTLCCGSVEAVFDHLPIAEPNHPLNAPVEHIEKQMQASFATIGQWSATSEELRKELAKRLGNSREIALTSADALV